MKNRLLAFTSDGALQELPGKLKFSVQKDLHYVLNCLHAIALHKKAYNHNVRSVLKL